MGSALIIVINLFYWFIYYNKFRLFEQFKIEKDQPWPWEVEEKREGFIDLVKRATARCLFNNTVVTFFCCYLTCHMYGW